MTKNKQSKISFSIKITFSFLLILGIIMIVLGSLFTIKYLLNVKILGGFLLILFGIIAIYESVFLLKDYKEAINKTIIEFNISNKFSEIQKKIIGWFGSNNFDFEIRKNNFLIGIKITSHPLGLKIKRIFEIKLESQNENSILFHGKFYILSSNMDNIPLSLTKKKYVLGSKYRNETYYMMEDLLHTIKKYDRR